MTNNDKPKFELTRTYVLDFTSVSGRRYTGVFEFKRPTIAERSRIGILKAQYGQGLTNLDEYTNLLHTAMATLDVVCIRKPEWFNYDQLYDDDVIFHVFVEYKKWEAFFRSEKGTTTAVPDTGGTKTPAGGNPEEVVV
jgi:hypothetical protein